MIRIQYRSNPSGEDAIKAIQNSDIKCVKFHMDTHFSSKTLNRPFERYVTMSGLPSVSDMSASSAAIPTNKWASTHDATTNVKYSGTCRGPWD
jgi:hypothetical protein